MEAFWRGPELSFDVRGDEMRSATPGVEEAVFPDAGQMIRVTYYEQEMLQALAMLDTFSGIAAVSVLCCIDSPTGSLYQCELHVFRDRRVEVVCYDSVTDARLFALCMRDNTAQIVEVLNPDHAREYERGRGVLNLTSHL